MTSTRAVTHSIWMHELIMTTFYLTTILPCETTILLKVRKIGEEHLFCLGSRVIALRALSASTQYHCPWRASNSSLGWKTSREGSETSSSRTIDYWQRLEQPGEWRGLTCFGGPWGSGIRAARSEPLGLPRPAHCCCSSNFPPMSWVLSSDLGNFGPP